MGRTVVLNGYGCAELDCEEGIHYDEDLDDWQHDHLTECRDPSPDCCLEGCALDVTHDGPCEVVT